MAGIACAVGGALWVITLMTAVVDPTGRVRQPDEGGQMQRKLRRWSVCAAIAAALTAIPGCNVHVRVPEPVIHGGTYSISVISLEQQLIQRP
jgi:hypothetical protein